MQTTIRYVVVLAVAALVLTATALPAQGGGGDKYKCRVKNMTTRVKSDDLQAQISAAEPGDTLKIKGVCIGTFTIPSGANLTLLGAEKAGIQGVLEGGGSGPVLKVAGDPYLTFVTLTDLTIMGGWVEGDGAGIYNRGSLTLSGSTQVIWNEAREGGGIYNLYGDLILSGSTIVAWNAAAIGGGGIFNESGNVRLEDSAEVSSNDANDGGGIFNSDGTLGLRGEAKVRWNDAHGGGGIANHGEGAKVTMYGWSQVSENTAYQYAGISNSGEANLQLDQWSEVVGNEADFNGGGIHNGPGSTAKMWADSTVTGNIADADNTGSGEGGGIYGCVEGAVDGENVNDNYLRTDASQVEDNIANGCD